METAVADGAVAEWQDTDPVDPHGGDDEGGLVIGGTGEQLSFSVGGKKPTSSQFRLTGGEIGVEGQFAKGEVIALRVEALVTEVAFRDELDGKTQQVVGAKRVHKGRIVGVERS